MQTLQSLENKLLVFKRYALSVVLYRKSSSVCDWLGTNFDFGPHAGAMILDCVRDEVLKQLL